MSEYCQTKIGIKYFFKGLSLCLHPSLRKFVFIPLLLNIIITSIALYFAFSGAFDLSEYITKTYLPDWLSFLKWLISTILWLIIFVITIYSFSAITLLIGSPFYSILAEKTESLISGKKPIDSSIVDVIKDIPHTIGLELLKFIYRVPLLIFNLIFLFIPVIGPILIALISSWGCVMDYTSYSFENNKISFRETREALGENKTVCLTFGLTVWLTMLIPVINFVIVPVAVCGGTSLWVECLRPKFENQIQLRELKNKA